MEPINLYSTWIIIISVIYYNEEYIVCLFVSEIYGNILPLINQSRFSNIK